ncbi:MAG: nicotinamide mononucleotide transporter [Ruminococcaceae bacterium]|nr:nicotinamide mononucleotide transporter [Oscillospiraceae bacterium]
MLVKTFKTLNKFELTLWISSCLLIIISFISAGEFNIWVLLTSLIGATALIFMEKGEPLGQILTVVFSLFYGYVSFTFQYWGEMITYLCMSAPAALAATISWLRNPFEKGKTQVKIKKITLKHWIIITLSSIAVTFIFYYILKYFNTPNLFFSTLSITTSFFASLLTFLRSPYYAIAYATNDIILIILWILASITTPSYVPMAMCFFIFLLNDSYAYVNWRRIERRQSTKKAAAEC